MRSGAFVLTAAFVALMAGTAGAQTDTPLTPTQIAIGCAPRPSLDGPPHDARHVIGGQDTVPKTIDAGADARDGADTSDDRASPGLPHSSLWRRRAHAVTLFALVSK